eukprot:943214-Rhodomonas_salina.1
MHLFMYCVCPDSEVRTAAKQALGDRLTSITTALREIYKGPQASQHAVEWADQFNATFTRGCAGLEKGNISYFKTQSGRDRILESNIQHVTTHRLDPSDYDLQTIFALIAAKRVFCGAQRFDNGGLPDVKSDTDPVPCNDSFGLSLLSRKYAYLNSNNTTAEQVADGKWFNLKHQGEEKIYWLTENHSESTDKALLFPVMAGYKGPTIILNTGRPYNKNDRTNPFSLDKCGSQLCKADHDQTSGMKHPNIVRLDEIRDDIPVSFLIDDKQVYAIVEDETIAPTAFNGTMIYQTVSVYGIRACTGKLLRLKDVKFHGDPVPQKDIYLTQCARLTDTMENPSAKSIIENVRKGATK